MIIGQPKSIDEIPVLTVENIKELCQHGMGMIQSGVPGEVPAAVPLNQLLQIIATVNKYHALAEKVAHIEAGVGDLPKLMDAWAEATEEAKALLATQPVKKPILAPTSGARLIIP